jgi:hypothetical protein
MLGRNESFPVSYFGVLLTVAIACAAVIWLAYEALPHELYLPVTLSITVVAFIVAFVVLSRRVQL